MSALNNIELIRQSALKEGILNKVLQNAILAVIGKESGFLPQSENLKYSAKRIREIWPKISELKAKELANNPVALANYVYTAMPHGMRTVKESYGNTAPGTGHAYRGRGFVQITFKNIYKNIGEAVGVDLVNKPELANDPKIAALIAVKFIKRVLNGNKALILRRYNIDINNLVKAEPLQVLKAVVNAVAGMGKSGTYIEEQYKKALPYFEYLQGTRNKFPVRIHGEMPQSSQPGKKIVIPLILLGALLYLLSRK